MKTNVLVGGGAQAPLMDDEDDRNEDEGSDDDAAEAMPWAGGRAFAGPVGRATALAAEALFDACPRFATPTMHETRVIQ